MVVVLLFLDTDAAVRRAERLRVIIESSGFLAEYILIQNICIRK